MAAPLINLTWAEAREIARQGSPVRRSGWPTNKYLTYEAGPGTSRAVAVLTVDGAVSVVKSTTFGEAEFKAVDWRMA